MAARPGCCILRYHSGKMHALGRMYQLVSRRVFNGVYMEYTVSAIARIVKSRLRVIPFRKIQMASLDLRSIHTEVISLHKRADRRKLLTARLVQTGLSFSYHSAMEFGDIDPKVLKQCFTKRSRSMLSEGSVAAAMSHVSLWQRLMSHDVPYALILEDDAIPVMMSVFAGPFELPVDFDIIFLGSGDAGKRNMSSRVAMHLYQPVVARQGLYAYLVSRKGLSRLLHTVVPVGATAGGLDTAVGKAILHKRLDAYMCLPTIFHHDDNSASDILNPSKPRKKIYSA